MDSRGFKNCKKRERTVSRAYGGSRCGVCVKQRYLKSFNYKNVTHFKYISVVE